MYSATQKSDRWSKEKAKRPCEEKVANYGGSVETVVRPCVTDVRFFHTPCDICSGSGVERAGEGYSVSPQSLQNLLPSGFTAVQREHFFGSNDWPHEGQNFASRSTGVLQ